MVFSSDRPETGLLDEERTVFPGEGGASENDVCLWRVERDGGRLDGWRGFKGTGQRADTAITFQAGEREDEGFAHKKFRFMIRDGRGLSSHRGGTFLIWCPFRSEKRHFMSVGRFFCMMMGVVLYLMMQLPSFVMPMAMVDGMMMSAPAHQLLPARDIASPDAVMVPPGGGMVMEAAVSSRPDAEEDIAPCCQSHHAVCEAGLLPEGQRLEPAGLWQRAVPFHDVRLLLRSAVVLPWRPPAILPV